MSQAEGLFQGRPQQPAPAAAARGTPRWRRPERPQPGWPVVAIDEVMAPEPPVRAVGAFARAREVRARHEAVKARQGVPGQAPPAPERMRALGLWARVEGVGSARQRARRCAEPLVSRGLCGGVSMNDHTLSDVRVAHGALWERLLANGVAALVAEGVGALAVLAQEGLGVRAAAGAGSLRRRREAIQARVARLRAERESDAGAGERRRPAGQQRAARAHQERAPAALDRRAELEAEGARRAKTNKAEGAKQQEPRAATTDPEARAMKRADGGFPPASNLQILSAAARQGIVAGGIETTGSERGLARPGLEERAGPGITPAHSRVEGGFTQNADIAWAHAGGIQLWCPAVPNKQGTHP